MPNKEYLISQHPTYEDFKKYYGLESTPGTQILLSDPHFNQIDKNGSYLTQNNRTLTEKDILNKWNTWQNIGPQSSINYGNPVQLDEIVVQPDKKQLNELRKAFPDNIIRQSMLKYINSETPDNLSTYDTANRLLELYDLAGKPSIKFNIVNKSMTQKVFGLSPDILIKNSIEYKNGERYPNYNTGKDILSEFGHSFAYKKDEKGNKFSDKIPWRIWDFRFPDFSIGKYKNAYVTPGSEEHIAHWIFEPAQYSFLTQRPIDYFTENNKNNSPDNKELVNSNWYKKNKGLYNTTIKSIEQLKEFVDKVSNNAIKYGLSTYNK